MPVIIKLMVRTENAGGCLMQSGLKERLMQSGLKERLTTLNIGAENRVIWAQ